jgi:hypothetical protein
MQDELRVASETRTRGGAPSAGGHHHHHGQMKNTLSITLTGCTHLAVYKLLHVPWVLDSFGFPPLALLQMTLPQEKVYPLLGTHTFEARVGVSLVATGPVVRRQRITTSQDFHTSFNRMRQCISCFVIMMWR